MKLLINISEQIKHALDDENQWSALVLAELKNIINRGEPVPDNAIVSEDKPQAEWINIQNAWICSKCRCDANYTKDGYQDKSDFCPSCGRQMKG